MNVAAAADGQKLLAVLAEPAVATLGLDEERALEVVDAALGRGSAEPTDELA